MPPKRQTVPLSAVRAAQTVNDRLTPAEVRTQAGVQGTAEDTVSTIATQLRLALGGRSWLDPPSNTGAGDPGAVLLVAETLEGAKDGENRAFTLSGKANPALVVVQLNGMTLLEPAFVVAEAVLGEGYDTVLLAPGIAPRERDEVTALYLPA